MNLFLKLAYLFFIGSVLGWVLELFYRRFISSANPERKWINPGFCVGPYVPLYGSGLCILYLLASFGDSHGTDTAGGRVLGVTGLGDNLPQALEKAYDAVKEITFEKVHYRTDIGKK